MDALAKIGVDSTEGANNSERDRRVPRPTLAAHNDGDGCDGNRDVEQGDGDRQKMMAELVPFAVP